MRLDDQPGRRGLRGSIESVAGNPDAFGSERSFSPEVGRHWEDPEAPLRGYYIDFSFKAEDPAWPPAWLGPRREQLHVANVQWGLGAFERFVKGEGEEWLRGALACGEHLIETQHSGGPQDGGWRHFFPMPHTYVIRPPWLSAIAQGEAASLLVRLHLETGDERFAEAARRGLAPMAVPVGEGGLRAELEGAPFVEEYPTIPPSYVLNGAIFALWGYLDVGRGLDDPEALEQFEALTSALVANLDRWDTGFWSYYDLYPHRVRNIASPAYHLLHIRQLEVLDRLSPRPELGAMRARFQGYRSSAGRRRKAMAQKVAFRIVSPRNPTLAHRLPWNTAPRRRATGAGRGDDVLVLAYHAISEDWDSTLAVTPERFDAQLRHLVERGYRAVTFADAVARDEGGRRVAITFDDGYRSVARLAKPILDAHGLSATVFVPTDLIDSERPMSWPGIDHWLDGPHADELIPMSWEEARALVEAGWEIGSHTRSHPRLTELGDEELARELAQSRLECEERLGIPCETIAYPYGDVDQRVVAAAMAAGYSGAAAVAIRERPGSYLVPRVGVYNVDDDRVFRLKISRPLRRLHRSHAWDAIDTVARPLRPRAPAVGRGS